MAISDWAFLHTPILQCIESIWNSNGIWLQVKDPMNAIHITYAREIFRIEQMQFE